MKLALVAFATLVGWANALYPVVMSKSCCTL